jgi:uncharacterized membrane protein
MHQRPDRRQSKAANETGPPQYSDFASLAFTIGMTFQASDADTHTSRYRLPA